MTDRIILDIETVAGDRAEEYYKNTYVPPRNLKDPDKIAAKRQEAAREAGLHWYTGKIICICWADVDSGNIESSAGADERQVLAKFFAACLAKQFPFLIGKNGIDFDIPFIVGRCIALDIGVPHFLRPHKPLDEINRIFGYSRNAQWGKLDDYAWGMGMDPKTTDGSKVQGMWDEGRLDDIVDYCAHDVKLTAEIFTRYCKEYTHE